MPRSRPPAPRFNEAANFHSRKQPHNHPILFSMSCPTKCERPNHVPTPAGEIHTPIPPKAHASNSIQSRERPAPLERHPTARGPSSRPQKPGTCRSRPPTPFPVTATESPAARATYSSTLLATALEQNLLPDHCRINRRQHGPCLHEIPRRLVVWPSRRLPEALSQALRPASSSREFPIQSRSFRASAGPHQCTREFSTATRPPTRGAARGVLLGGHTNISSATKDLCRNNDTPPIILEWMRKWDPNPLKALSAPPISRTSPIVPCFQ